ncbi:DNRLRE domain-containing protein [Streptomyces katsurahamanus]|uniref:DNRLRE domain-containing protein n=1 Tax=Streptomyces katsurahamanus TaxID=2577098 RepID=A0ABW9NY01_9ACTN|nr:DNRLRE domain-containing protein [Streptomyces katsurahamanus]MQS38205.1 DNRLRE domain-containing protein [Streptomyces katsurahamanus]
MTRNRRRLPGRRTAAALLVAAVAATGITYAGLQPDETGTRTEESTRERRSSPLTEAEAITRATETDKRVEIVALRTERSTTWAEPDGLMSKELYASPVRARVDGEWKKIDTTLRRTGRGWEPRATGNRMVFSAGSRTGEGDGARAGAGEHAGKGAGAKAGERASRTQPRRAIEVATVAAEAVKVTANEPRTPLASLHVGAHIIELTWPGPVPVPVIDGSRALYPEILPGADLVLTADNDGFAPLLVVKNRQAAADPRVRQLAYGIDSPDLSFRLDPETGVLGAENADGDGVAYSPTPLMWDNSGSPAVTDGTVGATAQPTEPETPDPVDTGTPTPTTGTSPAEEPVESDEQTDPFPEALPSASDNPGPTRTPEPLPSAPAEPVPAPSQTGPAATLGLSSLDGPSPDSRGEPVAADLNESTWTLTPDQDFLTDPATVYPVFIDPSVKEATQNWTTAYDRHPKATFYNGKGFNKGGTHEARIGFESDTWGTSRSFFNIGFDKDLKGTQIKEANLRLLSTYSWSCSSRSMSVHLTGRITSRTNWKNAPRLHNGNKITSKSFARGYNSGCRDEFVKFDVRKAAQKRADKGSDSITFGMRARDEDSQYAWKKFRANGDFAPKLEVIYNRRPNTPTSLDLGPDAKCTTTEPYVRMGSDELTFTARVSDKDRNLDFFDFDLWPTGAWNTSGDLLNSTGRVGIDADDRAAALGTTSGFPTSRLKDGTLYSWRVRAFDDEGATSPYAPTKTPCRFVLDLKEPKPPVVESADFPNADEGENGFGNDAEDATWSLKKFGTPGEFLVRARNTDVVRYEYGFNSANYSGQVPRFAGLPISFPGKIADAKPPTAGPNVLYVRAVDGAGNVSQPTRYLFYVTPRDQSDAPGDFTGDDLPDLMAVTEGGNLYLYPSQAVRDLSRGSGDLDFSMAGAYRANPEKDPSGDALPPYSAAAPGHFKGSLITHNGDVYGGDGLQDLLVRVGGRLWVYPGDGYGAVNVDKRREIRLPDNAPSPAAFTQITAAGDITDDDQTDLFVRVGDELWAFTGYRGGVFEEARRLSSTGWLERDIVSVQDVSGDGVADLVYRTDNTHRLLLRKGIRAAGGGVDLDSLGSAAASAGGADIEYAASGWSRTSVPLLMGTPDADGDSVPDIWAVRSDGSVRFHAGGKTSLPGSGSEIIGPNGHWKTRIAIG